MDKRIKKLEDEANEKLHELKMIRTLLQEFKDLDYAVDRWNIVRYKSEQVNPVATQYDLNHSCGCCTDAALYLRPYIERTINGKSVRIYSKPETFYIGEKAYSGGYHASQEWEKTLTEGNLNKELIEKVGNYLESNGPEYDYDDDDYDDDF